MLNSNSIRAVNHSTFSQKFVKPLYDSYCFANIPQTVDFLLTGEGQRGLPEDVFGSLPTSYERVIVFFVDAFGWCFFERYAEKNPFLKTILAEGSVSKMTSQFPSTTAAHTTCIHTGLNVGQSGVYEWYYYEPLVDQIITPLLFSYAGDKERDTLKQSGVPPEAFYPPQTLYQQLKAKKVVSYAYQHRAYTPSTFSSVVFQGASVVPFQTFGDGLNSLTDVILAHKAPPYYYFFYFDRIDAICHMYGPDSPELEKEVDTFFKLMEELFFKKLVGKVKKTLLMVTADHGQVAVSPKTTFYLNKQAPAIVGYLKTNRQGKLLVPAGSARDMFLHIHEEYLDTAIDYLQARLEGRAEVYKVQDLLTQGFFGSQQPSSAFLGRVGNVVILPYANETVWWYEEGKFDMKFSGHHGGLTPQEMEIPLLLFPL